MNKPFEVGDLVRVIRNSGYEDTFDLGEIAKVTGMEKGCGKWFADVETPRGCARGFLAERFVLVQGTMDDGAAEYEEIMQAQAIMGGE